MKWWLTEIAVRIALCVVGFIVFLGVMLLMCMIGLCLPVK
jgi:hypothetical protein